VFWLYLFNNQFHVGLELELESIRVSISLRTITSPTLCFAWSTTTRSSKLISSSSNTSDRQKTKAIIYLLFGPSWISFDSTGVLRISAELAWYFIFICLICCLGADVTRLAEALKPFLLIVVQKSRQLLKSACYYSTKSDLLHGLWISLLLNRNFTKVSEQCVPSLRYN